MTYEPIDWDNWGAPEHQGEHPDYGDCERCGHAREWWDVDPGPREALVIADGMGDSAYGARPGDEVAVIPVHPAQAARSIEVAVGAAV